jgi:nucleoside-diphosphate-sugar epimerase
MKILVTGGAGYIGSVLVPMLLSCGHEVTVVDNFMYQQTSLLDCCHDPKFTIIRGDVRDSRLMNPLIKCFDAIIPLACLTGAPLCDERPEEARDIIVNIAGYICNIVSRDQYIIYPTTNSGYGIGEKGKLCTERSPLNPISLYGQYKKAAENHIMGRENSISLRLATAFGMSSRMRLDLLVNDFVYRAVTQRSITLFEANAKRNFVHVRDVARAFLHCINSFSVMKSEVYNVGLSDANLSKRELCEEIKKKIPNFYIHEAEIGEDPDKRDYIVSNEKIESAGFRAEVSLPRGIKELIQGYAIIRQKQFSNV